MVNGWGLLLGLLVLGPFVAYCGHKIGSTRGNWATRLASAFGVLAGFGMLCMPDFFYFAPTTMYCTAFDLMTFSGFCLMASWLSSPDPRHNWLLPENENKPSVKAASLMFSLGGIIFAMACFMAWLFISVPVYHDAPWTYTFVVTLMVTAALTVMYGAYQMLPPRQKPARGKRRLTSTWFLDGV